MVSDTYIYYLSWIPAQKVRIIFIFILFFSGKLTAGAIFCHFWAPLRPAIFRILLYQAQPLDPSSNCAPSPKMELIYHFCSEFLILSLFWSFLLSFVRNIRSVKTQICIENPKFKNPRTQLPSKIVLKETYVFGNAKFDPGND